MLHIAEPRFLKTGPNGPESPQSFGAPYERVSIASDSRILEGNLVTAAPECAARGALLIFHGVMETISDWSAAQALLRDQCVDSLVFDYTGHGNSSPGASVKRVNRDAAAALRYFAHAIGPARRLCVLGHSMGNGPMLEGLPSFAPPPACAVVASPLSSLRDWGVAHVSRVMKYLIPDVWNSVASVSGASVPLLVTHSRSDRVNPVEMGRRVFAAAREPKCMIELDGFEHNALYKAPTLRWWSPVIAFVRDGVAADCQPR